MNLIEKVIEENLYKKENSKWFVHENNYIFEVVNEFPVKFKNENKDIEKFSIKNDLFIRKSELGDI